MFGNAPRAVWERWIKPDTNNRIPLSCRAMLIEIGEEKILCETGIGQFFEPKLRDRFGVEGEGEVLLQSLHELGLDEKEITAVLLSHLHFDHAGGLLTAFEKGPLQLHFPRAQYYVSEQSWKRALQPHPRDRASFIPALQDLLQQSGRLNIVQGERHPALPDSLTFRLSHGHTPGQMHTIVRGPEQRVIFAGDLIPASPWVHVPITMGYDRFPELIIDEKQSLLEEWAGTGDWIFFTHDHLHSAAKIKKDQQGKFSAEQCQAEWRRFALN